MKRYQLQKINVASAAKIYLAFGTIIGVIFSGLSLLTLLSQGVDNLPFVITSGLLMLFFYAVFGAGMAALMVWLYNQIAQRVGGLVIYLKEEEQLTPGPIPKRPEINHDDPTLI